MKITEKRLRKVIRKSLKESLDKMYGEENLDAWEGAYNNLDSGRSRIPNDIADIAYEAGAAGRPVPDEVEDLMDEHAEVYRQAMEAYDDGWSEYRKY